MDSWSDPEYFEYFATGTVLLLRALGIPARYVSGFSVQDYSHMEKRFLIRERHAHAWAEAYVDGRWIEIDNTPGDWVAAEDAAAPFWAPLADTLSFAAHAFTEWRRDGGAGKGLNVVAVIVLGMAAIWIWRRLRHSPTRRKATENQTIVPTQLQAKFQAFEADMALFGLARNAAEPPRHWLNRIAREGSSVVDAPRIAAAIELVVALYCERYGKDAA